MKKKILFIINPISGGQSKRFIPSLIDRYLDANLFDAHIVFTNYAGHAYELAKQAVEDDTDIVVSVGGDGTINEVASALCFSSKTMAIVPCGSGNGLARTLHIPLLNKNAIKRINCLNTMYIDVGILHDRKFFNIAGLGFDAHISSLFASDKKRGFKGYLKSIFNEIFTYQSQELEIEIDHISYTEKVFILSFANSSQYGNNAHIAPKASLNDGFLDVCIIKPFPIYLLPIMAWQMLTKQLESSKYVNIIKGKSIRVKRQHDCPVHVDGEPFHIPLNFKIELKPLSLKLIV